LPVKKRDAPVTRKGKKKESTSYDAWGEGASGNKIHIENACGIAPRERGGKRVLTSEFLWFLEKGEGGGGGGCYSLETAGGKKR